MAYEQLSSVFFEKKIIHIFQILGKKMPLFANLPKHSPNA